MSAPEVLRTAAADADEALTRLDGVLAAVGDGDLHLASPDGGWTVAQYVSHVNVSVLLWVANMQRLATDPDLDFFWREEVGHDALGYPPPTVEAARGQLASTRATIATCLPAVDPSVLDREVTIPDLGTLTVAEWTPPIIGHATGHVQDALDTLASRDALPEEGA